MNEQRYQIIKPADVDAIPRSVAIELLTNPKAKLSARMRKNCRAALDKVFISTNTIRWTVVDDLSQQPETRDAALCYDTGCKPKLAVDRIAGKLRSVAWSRLTRLWSRVQRRINGLTFKRTRVMFGRMALTEDQRNSILEAIRRKIAQLEVVRDCATNEINRRAKI